MKDVAATVPLFRWLTPRLAGWARYGLPALIAAVLATPALAQDGLVVRQSPFLSWTLLLAVFALIWLIFYKGLYPIFLRYFHPTFCKFLFWSLFFLYGLAWLHLSLYILFEYGYWYPWMRWVAVFLTALWLIWFAVAAMTKRA